MKKFLIVMAVLFLCVVAGLGIFIATFDANRYGSVVVRKASEALGRPVHLGRLSLVWKNGIALRLEDLIVYADAEKTSKALSLKEASAVVRLLPLLHKEVQIASISIFKPFIHLVKNSDGSVQVEGIKTPMAGPATTGQSAPSDARTPGLLSVGSFTVEDGELRFEDRSVSAPISLSVRDLDVKVKNFSLTRPFSFNVAASVFPPEAGSAKQNIHITGTLLLPSATKKGFVEKVTLQTGLADLDLRELAKAVPVVRSAGLEGNLGGKLEAQCQHADLGPDILKGLKASVRLQNVALKLQSLQSPFENVQLTANVSGEDLNVENFSANFAEGTVQASAKVRHFATQAISDVKWSARDLAVDELMPAQSANAPRLGGRLSLDFSGGASGIQWPQIAQTLSGRGRLNLKDGVLLNYNLLREVIQKISIIPGAEGVLQQQLPGLYKAKLGEPSTILQPIDLPFTVQNGTVVFNQLLLVTDLLLLEGSGQVGLDKNVQANAHLHIHRELSRIMMNIVPQIQLLANAQGEIEIPMQIQGQFPRVTVLPDKEYLTEKFLASGAQELVTGLVKDPSKGVQQLRNLLDKPVAAGEAGLGLQNLLNQAIGRSSSSASPGAEKTNQ